MTFWQCCIGVERSAIDVSYTSVAMKLMSVLVLLCSLTYGVTLREMLPFGPDFGDKVLAGGSTLMQIPITASETIIHIKVL